MLWGFFGNLIFAIIARILCGNHLKKELFKLRRWVSSLSNRLMFLLLPSKFCLTLIMFWTSEAFVRTSQNVSNFASFPVLKMSDIFVCDWDECIRHNFFQSFPEKTQHSVNFSVRQERASAQLASGLPNARPSEPHFATKKKNGLG